MGPRWWHSGAERPQALPGSWPPVCLPVLARGAWRPWWPACAWGSAGPMLVEQASFLGSTCRGPEVGVSLACSGSHAGPRGGGSGEVSEARVRPGRLRAPGPIGDDAGGHWPGWEWQSGHWEGEGTGPPGLGWKNPERRVMVRGSARHLGRAGLSGRAQGLAGGWPERGCSARGSRESVGCTELWLFTGDNRSVRSAADGFAAPVGSLPCSSCGLTGGEAQLAGHWAGVCLGVESRRASRPCSGSVPAATNNPGRGVRSRREGGTAERRPRRQGGHVPAGGPGVGAGLERGAPAPRRPRPPARAGLPAG